MLLQRWSRFLVVGAVNTAMSYFAYLLLKLILDYQIAYFFAYVAGIVWSYFLNAALVFHSHPSWRTFLQFPIVYIAQYVIGALLLKIFVDKLMLSDVFAPLLVTVLTLPITYVLARSILIRKQG